MAEAITRSGKFDIFHVESMMIPSLAAAGMLEPLDEHMKAVGFDLKMVGNFETFMQYQGKTYGDAHGRQRLPAVHPQGPVRQSGRAQGLRRQARQAPEVAGHLEDELEVMKFFHRPDKELYGFGGLRDKANSSFWYWMYLYSAGGFPFDDDANPTLNTPAAEYAFDTWLARKQVPTPRRPPGVRRR